MLSQPPSWSALNGVSSLPNRQTSDHLRLETQSTKGNNLCDVTDPIDIEKGSLSDSDVNNVSHFKSKLTELDIRWERVGQAAKRKLVSLQKRLRNVLPKLRKSHHDKKEKQSYKKY